MNPTAKCPSPTAELTVRSISDLEELRSLERHHHALFASCVAPHIGTAFPYLIADAATGGPENPWRLFTVFRHGELAGCLYGRRFRRTTMRVRMPVFECGPYYVADPLVHPVDRARILHRLIEAMQDDQHDCVMFVFPRLSAAAYEALERSANELALPRHWRWGKYAYRFDTSKAPDAFLAELDGKARRELIRRDRRLAEEHGSEFVREEGRDADMGMERFEAFMALEDSGWKGMNESSIRRRPGYHPYFRELVKSASRSGLLVWYTLRAGGRPAAMYLALRSDDTLWLPKVGYDESLGAYGPGKLLTHHVLMDGLANPAIRQIDNISAAPWVQPWKPVQVPFRSMMLFSRSPRSRLVQGARETSGLARRLTGRARTAPGPTDHPYL